VKTGDSNILASRKSLIQDKSIISLNDSNMLTLKRKCSNLLAFREDKFSALPSKNKVADKK
jgi:hypothetical protein